MVYADDDNVYITFPKSMLGTLNRALVKGVSALKCSDQAPTTHSQNAEFVLINFLDEILCAQYLTEESSHEFQQAFGESRTTLKAKAREIAKAKE